MNTLDAWKDALILRWDGELPPEAPEGAIHEHDDLLHFWTEIRDFAKWNKKFNAFLLDFSRQNLSRIKNQFGRVYLTHTAKNRIEGLKKEYDEFRAMIDMAQKVKSGEIDVKVDYKLPPLAQYQHTETVLQILVPRVPIFADCGTGKTFCALVATEHQIKHGIIGKGKTLICAKLPTIEDGWMEDCEKFTDMKLNNLWIPPKSKTKAMSAKERRRSLFLEQLNDPADAYVINHEGIIQFEEELKSVQWEKIILDESTILKGFKGMSGRRKTGKFGQALCRVADTANWRVIMTGTPAPNGPEDLWGQLKFIDPRGFLLEGSFWNFQNEYLKRVYFGKTDDNGYPINPDTPSKWVPRTDTVGRVRDIVDPASYRVRIRDHLQDLPERTTLCRKVAMTPKQKKHYKEMEKSLATEINDEFVSVELKLTQVLKLRQITGGFIRDHEDKDHAIEDAPKLDLLDQLLDEEIDPENKVVIFSQYRWEIETIISRYKCHGVVSVYGGNSAQKNLQAIKTFKEDPNTRLIVLHPRSAAHGVTLTVAHYMIFYSISHSEEENYQCIKRIERASQKNAMFVYYLLCRDSVDELIYKVLSKKKRDQEKLIDQADIDRNIVSHWSSAYEGTGQA